MIARVHEVLPNQSITSKNGKTFTATVLKVVTEPSTFQGRTKPSEERTYNVFPNAPMHPTVIQLKKGDRVDLKFVQNGAYKNLDSVTLLEGGAPQQNAPAPTVPMGQVPAPTAVAPPDTAHYDRLEALVLAHKMVAAVYEKGGYFKAKSSPNVLLDSMIETANRIVRFVKGEAEVPGEMGAIPEAEGGEEGEEEVPF